MQSIVSYVLGNQQESLILLGTAALFGTGNAADNFLVGNSAANTLHGGDGKDIVDGGAGNDSVFGDGANDILSGGVGNDGLHGGEGNDTLYGMDGTDTLSGDAGDDRLYGGNGGDALFGGEGDDYLDGGAGIDALHGGNGNDHYVLDVVGEIDISEPDPGQDTVSAPGNYSLGANQENISFYESDVAHPDAHVGNGNGLSNTITGGVLSDTLFGFDGDDFLDGGLGLDRLVGGNGNDTYAVDNAGDIDPGDLDAGRDRVYSSINYSLGPQQEELVLTGTATLNGSGNVGNNFLVGNTAANILHGSDGADQIRGGGGFDQLFGDAGDDTLFYAADATHIDGGAGAADALYLTGSGASVSLDLSQIDDALITGIENILFATNIDAANQAHTLSFTASDVLALSDTTDTVVVVGESDDMLLMTDTGWSQGSATLIGNQIYNSYSNGTAHLLVDNHITEVHFPTG